MNHLLTILICCLSYTVFGQIQEQQMAFQQLNVKQGLSQNSVISMAQDSIGYMWFATQDGLNKYDGKTFKHYNKQFEDITRASFSKLGKIYIDTQNRLWIITHSGILELYQPQTDAFTPIPLSYKASTIFQDQNKNLFIGSYNNGLFKVDARTKDTLQVFIGKHKELTVYDLSALNNDIWATTSGGIFKISEQLDYKKMTAKFNTDINYSAITIDRLHSIWVGSYGHGLFYKTKKQTSFNSFKHPDLPESLNIEDLLIDSKNRLWIATYGQGVYLIDLKNNSVRNFKANKTNPFAIHYNDMLCIFEDITGVLWFGSDGTGASFYDEHLIKFNILTNNQVPNDVNVDMVRAITTDSNQNLWIGTSGKGLTYFNAVKDQYETLTTSNSNLSSNRIISLNYYENELWIGHQGYGLNIQKSPHTYTSFPALKTYTIWGILAENKNSRWLATERHGLILFNKKRGAIKRYTRDNSDLKSNNIRCIFKQNDSILWLGSDSDGVYKLNTQTEQLVKIEALDGKIKSLFYSDNNLWVGTLGSGLIKYNLQTQTSTHFTSSEGLPNNVVYGILPDKNKNLWLSTNNGLCKFNPEDHTVETFAIQDGLQNVEFNTGAYYKSETGILYFGGLEGINWFTPEQLSFNLVKPKTVISKFEVFSKPKPMVENLNLNSNTNTVTFTFSSLHYSQPERNAYKYKLLNYDQSWINAQNNNVAHYTNLPPETYTFQVISSNYDGVWNPVPASYSFTILQPWYATNGMKALYVACILLLLYGMYSYLKFRWQLKTQLQLEHAETERLKKLDEFKTNVYTNISHEIRTPLTLISGPIDHLLSKNHFRKTDRKALNLIQQSTYRLLDLVNQMVDLAISDSGQAKLRVSPGNLTVLLQQIIEAFCYKASEKHITIQHKIIGLEHAWFDTDIIEKVISNLVLNAIKYAPNNTTIVFTATNQDKMMVCTVLNETYPMSKADLGKLFQRFYQNDKASDGFGVGLALVEALVSLAKGSISAKNTATNTIQFIVSLPITKDAFTTDEIQLVTTPNNTPETPLQVESSLKDAPCILIVEDQIDIRNFIVTIFKDRYKVIEASNGKVGIDLALEHIPDLIISDIMMPFVDGINLCNTLKYNAITSHIPIILLTAKFGIQNEIEGLKTGADAYVTKPFNSKKLELRVEKLIENRNKMQTHILKTFSIAPEVTISTTESKFLKQLKDVTKSKITHPDFNAEEFAKAMHMSRTQLHRKLKAIVGVSTTEFIRTQRLQMAVDIFKKDPNLSISEVAYQVGFNTPSYFIKCFKSMYKDTPNAYIKQFN